MNTHRLDPALWNSAPTSFAGAPAHLDADDDLRRRWQDGECVCAVDTRTGQQSCERLTRVDETEHGPRLHHEPCTPTRTGADESRRMNARLDLARAWNLTRAAMAWTRTDATTRSPARLSGTMKNYSAATRSVDVIASTPKPVDGEALASWDLDAFRRLPTVLWAHGTEGTLPIGKADDIEVTPDGELRMRVTFASERANPLAEQVSRLVDEGIVRGVSVGYEPGEITSTANGVTTRAANVLREISFCAVPLDEDAHVEDDDPQARASDAGRTLRNAPRRCADDETKKRFGIVPSADDYAAADRKERMLCGPQPGDEDDGGGSFRRQAAKDAKKNPRPWGHVDSAAERDRRMGALAASTDANREEVLRDLATASEGARAARYDVEEGDDVIAKARAERDRIAATAWRTRR